MFIPIIMAGGTGTRFWPMSRTATPKQYLSIISETSLIAEAVERLSRLAPVENICIATTANQADLVHEHLPRIKEENILIEPAKRDTGPCIGYAAFNLRNRYPDEDLVVGVFPADHVIRDHDIFEKTIFAAAEAAREDEVICQIGIPPSFPSTGFGYIHRGPVLKQRQGFDLYGVQGFREKPGPETAEEYVESGDYYWNAGMFIFKPQTMIEEFEACEPDMYARLSAMAEGADPEEIYPTLEKISIDYAIIEKTERRAVVEAQFYWDDVGAWDAVAGYFDGDERDNVVKGEFMLHDCRDCTVINNRDQLIAGVGLSDLIVVNTEDALLLCHRKQAQHVKKIVKRLTQEGRDELL